ncbi:SAM-dependent methyltransferase [Streptomyces sp. NPDC050704]|uniref:SAM-dependent methyltransferase n=1 Tax=Streptomyces sp. NPDC050704 TaxID=3157219 RepID=UPI0034359166
MLTNHPATAERACAPAFVPADRLAGVSSARVHNYLLGGRDHYERDSELADRLCVKAPFLTDAVRCERQYVLGMVQALAVAGIRQLIDFGCGLPHSPSPVEVIARIHPDTRVVCVDNDRAVLAHARAFLHAPAPAVVEHLCADVSNPQTVLASPELLRTINLHEPTVLLFGSVLHHLPDPPDELLAALVDRYKEVTAPGSALVITHATADFAGKPIRKAAKALTKAGCPVYPRSREEVMPLFDGWALSSPGLTSPQEMALKHPVGDEAASYVGMARNEGGQ